MMDHDEMMAAKVAMLEAALGDLLVDRFCAMPDPVGEVRRYAEWRRLPAPSTAPDERMRALYEAVWDSFLDRVQAEVVQRTGVR
jgi:hypothetical protein